MANTRHLKRHSTPKAWGVKRKGIAFISKPNPGSLKRKYSTSLLILLRDVLGYAQTSKEVKALIRNEEILFNGKKIDDIKTPCGLFDVVEIKKTKEKFRLVFNEFGNFKTVPVKQEVLYLKLIGKTVLRGGKFQLNFINGYTLVCDEKTFKSCKVNDTLIYDFIKKKVVSFIEFKEEKYVYILDGNFQGQIGLIKKIVRYNGLAKDVCEVQIGKEIRTTARDYCYVIGSKKEDLEEFE